MTPYERKNAPSSFASQTSGRAASVDEQRQQSSAQALGLNRAGEHCARVERHGQQGRKIGNLACSSAIASGESFPAGLAKG